MYYVWEQNLKLEDDFAVFTDEPESFRSALWTSAEKLVDPPAFDLVGDTDSPTTLSDLLLTVFPLQVVSPKLAALLTEIGVNNIQFLPVKVINHQTKAAEKAYRIANIVGAIDCLDLSKSTFDRSSRTGSITGVWKFRI